MSSADRLKHIISTAVPRSTTKMLLHHLALIFFAFAAVCCLGDEIDQRIVGGEVATYGDHYYICSLQSRRWSSWYHICGSVIWNRQHVVTAAHCLSGSASNLRVVCGNHRISYTDPYQVTHSLASYTLHPQWNPSGAGYPNDIAVMRLSTPLTFNSHVNKVTFAESGSFLGNKCTLSGWGRLSGGGSTAQTLKKVGLTKISRADCAARWQNIGGASINSGHICFYEGHGYSACNGDSGGPARCGNVLTGITSWGINTCSGSYPSVYTRVSEFHTWLQSAAGPQ